MNTSLTIHGNSREAHFWAEEYSRAKESWQKELGEFLKQWISDGSSITVQTSGSTGIPKAIRLEKTSMLASAKATGEFLRLENHHNTLICLPARTIAGMMMIVRAMLYQQNLMIVPPDGNPLRNLNPGSSPDFTAMVPAQVFNTLKEKETRERFFRIKTVIIGGGEISHVLEQKLFEAPNNVFATYGMTETITHIALRRLSGPDRSNNFRALPGIHFTVDARGCLVVHVPRIGNQPIVTNDLVELSDNQTFRWLGRIDNVINRGGVKLVAEDIERKILTAIPTRYFVTSKKDEKYGEVPVLVMESAPLTKDSNNDLLRSVAKMCEWHERPVSIITFKVFIETGSGKINRKTTLEQA